MDNRIINIYHFFQMKDDLQEYYKNLELWLEELGFGIGDIEGDNGNRFVANYNPVNGEKEEVFVLPNDFQDIPLPLENNELDNRDDLDQEEI